MTIPFFKYHGAGNDFIIIDERQNNYLENIPEINKSIRQWCHRRFGIGADGLMILRTHPEYDFQMIYYNSDGFEGTMCGNGGRCLVAFAFHQNIIGPKTIFLATDGLHHAQIIKSSKETTEVALGMINVDEIKILEGGYFMNTGSPHLVKFIKSFDTFNVFDEGSKIRQSDAFRPEGTNVNFARNEGELIHVRTYERGVEDETLACGTGITAVAIAAHQAGIKAQGNVYKLKALGGDLQVSFFYEQNRYRDIVLQGPAVKVFKGEIVAH